LKIENDTKLIAQYSEIKTGIALDKSENNNNNIENLDKKITETTSTTAIVHLDSDNLLGFCIGK